MSKHNRICVFTITKELKLIDGEVFVIEQTYNRKRMPITVRVTKIREVHNEQ
jgi:hypothetical protein